MDITESQIPAWVPFKSTVQGAGDFFYVLYTFRERDI